MSEFSPSAVAATAAPSSGEHLGGLDIAEIMSSQGPVVKCVVLRAAPRADAPSSSSPQCDNDSGQKDASSLSVKEMKRELSRHGVNTAAFVEKRELVAALEEARRGAAPLGDKEEADAKVVTQDDVDGDDDDANSTKEVPLRHLIEEVEVDTTPRKSMVAKTLGGDFTFLGQYEDEGTMVMVRRPDWEALEDLQEGDIPAENPHTLQPPLHRARVRGDILLMRVAKTEEELDREEEKASGDGAAVTGTEEDDGIESAAAVNAKAEDVKGKQDHDSKKSEDAESGVVAEAKAAEEEQPSLADIHVPTNDEFFLDYTREEYLKFAARTDIVARDCASSSEEEESDDEEAEGPRPCAASLLAGTNKDGDDADDGDFDPDADSDDGEEEADEEHQVGMMNLILGAMLRRFREEHGHGPDSLELLEMRKALADRLGVAVPPVDERAWEEVEPKASTTPVGKKRVVVAEERNETEEIPRRRTGEKEDEEGEEEDEEDEDKSGNKSAGQHNEANEDVDGLASLKRTSQDIIDDSECNDHKRPRIGGDNSSSGSNDKKGEIKL